MIAFSLKYRSKQAEIMDDLDFQGKEMALLLKDLKFINRWLGGNSITWKGIKSFWKGQPEPFSVVDLGCGDGEQLRYLAVQSDDFRVPFALSGVDANRHILEVARKRSRDYGYIAYKHADVFADNFILDTVDVATCTLFLHHFKEEEIMFLLKKLILQVERGVVVNDLQRSPLAFGLFGVFSGIFLKTKTARHDGLVSIARGFRRKELKKWSRELSEALDININHRIRWCWAFRYQWVISKEV